MKRNTLFRAMLLAGLLAASGAAQAAVDDLSPTSSVQMQTWYFPDGSNHTVMSTPRPGASGPPDTSVLGAGPASLPTPMLDEPVEEASNVITQTWFFPDGSNHTMVVPAT
jgi:hypothetical protein